MKVMVVDDNEQNLYLLEVLLRSEKYEVVCARDGLEALEHLRKGSFSLIISDILMPRMDGFQLCRECKVDPHLKDIPFIFYTATYTDRKDEELGLSLGADRYVIKPQEPEVLMQIIRDVLAEARAEAKDTPEDVSQGEGKLLKEYSEALFRKLEKKMADLEQANLALTRTITERKQTEEALRESEKKYRTLVTESPDDIFIVDLQGTFLAVNKAMRERLKYSEEEFLSMKIWDIVPEKYVDLYKKRLSGILRGEAPKEALEYVVRGKDKKIHYMEVLSNPYFRENELIGFQGIARDITERKRVEMALTQERRRFKQILDNFPYGIYIVDQDSRIEYVNPVLQQEFGDPGSRKCHDYFHDLPEPCPWCKNPTVFEGETVYWEWHSPKNDREYELVDIPLHNDDGTVSKLEVFHDITERKWADEALRESEERYRLIAENADDFVYWVAPDGNFRYVSPSCERVTGYSPAEFTNHPQLIKEIVDPEDRETVERHSAKVREDNRPDGLEFRIITKTGEVRWMSHSCSLIYTQEGQYAGRRGTNRNITERKRVEVELLESEHRLRRFYESGMLGVIYWNMKGQIIDANDKFLEMVGYTRDELESGKIDWINITPPEFRYLDDNAVKELKAIGVNRTPFEKEYIRKDGTRMPIILAGAMLDEEHFNGVAFVLDITERKRAEQETASLQNQLRQSQKVEAIGQLAGGIAHDFNNLLTIIQGNSQLSLMELQEGDPLRANIEQIREAGERAADLTRQLLAFSRKQILEMRVLDLNQVLQRLDKMLRRVIGEDIDLTMFLPELIWKVKADPGQLEQVIMNLSVNARDAMPEGGKLTIETASVELDEEYANKHIAVQPGRYVMLSISDTGVGMTPEVRERVFEPFFTTKEKGKGTGLGLSTVYGIVKQSGGNIWVYSEPGQGTTFKIYLPEVDEPVGELKEEVVGEVLQGDETILIVEDEDVVRKLAVRVLKKQGYKVLEAPDGGKAFMLCEEYKEPIHLILTDVVMPGMSGRKLVDRLKAIHPEIKVLYMSGYTDNAILHHGVLEPGTNFIQKPFNVDGLARKVREVLDK